MGEQAVLYGIGVGPGAPDLITLRAMCAIEECAVVACPRTSSGNMLALDTVRATCDLTGKTIMALDFAMSRDAAVLKEHHDAAAKSILGALRSGDSVAFLTLGDVTLYSTFTPLAERAEEAGFQTTMVPGVPSFCAIAATLGIDLTPQMNDPVHIIPSANSRLAEVLDLPGTKVIMKAGKRIEEVKGLLRAQGKYDKAQAIQNCGMPNENIARNLDAVVPGEYFTTVVVLP